MKKEVSAASLANHQTNDLGGSAPSFGESMQYLAGAGCTLPCFWVTGRRSENLQKAFHELRSKELDFILR